jgi:hypothetical protein
MPSASMRFSCAATFSEEIMGRNKTVRQKTYDLNEGKSSGLTIFVND